MLINLSGSLQPMALIFYNRCRIYLSLSTFIAKKSTHSLLSPSPTLSFVRKSHVITKSLLKL